MDYYWRLGKMCGTRKKIVRNFSKRWHCKHQYMQIKILVMCTTCFTCCKNTMNTTFLYFVSENFTRFFSLKDCTLLIKLFYKNSDCAPVALQKFHKLRCMKKRLWSDDCVGSVKIDSKIQKDRFFSCTIW